MSNPKLGLVFIKLNLTNVLCEKIKDPFNKSTLLLKIHLLNHAVNSLDAMNKFADFLRLYPNINSLTYKYTYLFLRSRH